MIQFGTGGWRAIIGEDFIKSNIQKLAEGVYRLMKADNKLDRPVVIGRDRRFLSDEAAHWMTEVLCAHGVTVWVMKRSVPTPLVMHTVMKHGLHFGLQVTASHNPPEYNGVKLITEEGRDAPVELTERLQDLIEQVTDYPVMPYQEAKEKGLAVSLHAPFNDYLDDIISQIDMTAIRETNPRILFDPMHGSGIYALMVILYTARATIDSIHFDRDTLFGGSMPAPTPETLTELTSRVISGKYELGIALDGDGDRLGIIDANGRYINANETLVMLYYYLHEIKGWKGPVVRNLGTTHMLDKVAASFGETCYEVPVGFKYISAKIDEKNAVLGGESSGGLTVRSHIHGKDSTYAAALFVEMICSLRKSPSQIMDELTEKYGEYHMYEDNLRFKPEDYTRINRILMQEKQLPDFGKEIDHVSYQDGCKVYFKDDSFALCRFSGTESLLRIFSEADKMATAKAYCDRFRTFLHI